MNVAFFQSEVPGVTQCVDPVIVPLDGITPRNIDVTCAQPGVWLFYTKGVSPGVPPTHSGNTATGTTVRVTNNHFGANTGTGEVTVQVVAYEAGYLDSNIVIGEYAAP